MHAAAVSTGNPVCDSQPKAHAARLTVTRARHPKERPENVRQLLGRHSWSAIGDSDRRAITTVGRLTIQLDVHRRAGRRIANRIADHILDRAPDQVGIGVEMTLDVRLEIDPTIALGRFPLHVGNDLGDERRQVDPLPLRGCRGRIEPRDREKTADDVVQPLTVALDAVERGILPEALPREPSAALIRARGDRSS